MSLTPNDVHVLPEQNAVITIEGDLITIDVWDDDSDGEPHHSKTISIQDIRKEQQ